jgi:HEAT repeat protein
VAEVAEQEAAGSNRRIWIVVGIVVLIIAYLVARSVQKKMIISGLRSEENSVRAASTQKLMDMKILTDVLSRQPVPVKRPMIRTLRDMNTEAAADQLIALMKDRNPTVQNEAQFALQRMAPTSIGKLVGALGNPDLNVKNRAAMALIAIGDSVLAPVEKDGKQSVPLIDAIATPAARPGVTQVVTTLRGDVVPWLLQKLADENADAGTKACAIDILGRLGAQEAAKPIRAMLDAPDVPAPIRNAVLVALGRLRHPDAYALLNAAIADKDPSVVSVAIIGFGELQNPAAVSLLQKYLFGYNEALRDAAVAALSKIGAPAVPALAGLVKSPRYEVRIGALRALEGIDDARTPGIIASALNDPDENVRRMAAEALGRPGDARGIVPLIAALNDPEWRVAARARDSLAEIGSPAVPALVATLSKAAQSSASFYAQQALARIGSPAVPALMSAARSGNVEARQRAVLVLGTIGDSRAVDLLKSLSTNESVPAVRQAAERALKQVQEGRRVG